MYLGLDIGYSSLKVAHTHPGGQRQHLIMSVGVTSADDGTDYFGAAAQGVLVTVDGESYLADMQPHMTPDHTRTLDSDYTATPHYRALFHAALASTGSPVINRVATGLPVDQFFNRGCGVERLQGRHQDTPDRVVEIREVKVYPQPAGTYIAYLAGLGGKPIR